MIKAHIYVRGRVQNVGFRSGARRKALQLGLVGWVRNLRDGRVEVVAEGPEEGVEELITWCRRGPLTAHVSGVEVIREEPTGEFSAFGVWI
jgi:acylphosphatase